MSEETRENDSQQVNPQQEIERLQVELESILLDNKANNVISRTIDFKDAKRIAEKIRELRTEV